MCTIVVMPSSGNVCLSVCLSVCCVSLVYVDNDDNNDDDIILTLQSTHDLHTHARFTKLLELVNDV